MPWTRRLATLTLLIGVLAAVSCGTAEQTRTCRDEFPGLNCEPLDAMVAAIDRGEYGDMYGVAVIIDGELVSESYFDGHTGDELYRMFSVTKSFLSGLIGIAIDEGHIPSVDAKMLDYFLEYDDIANVDARKEAITIGHLLSMSAGFQWDELSLPYAHPENDFQKYTSSSDRIKYVLDQPVVHEPGTLVAYNTSLSLLLSSILTKATGMSAADYARTKLFEPLGIRDWEWTAYDRKMSVGGWGLSLRLTDMAKLGQLFLQEGEWNGVQVVSADWVRTSTSSHGSINPRTDYGYHWWLYTDAAAEATLAGNTGIYFAVGRGGQYVWVLPHANAVIVCTGWNDANGYWPEPLLWRYLGPAIERGRGTN